MTDHIQKTKEEARRLALQLGFALEHHGEKIESVTVDGERQVLIEDANVDQAWNKALAQIKQLLAKDNVENSTFNRVEYPKITIYADGGSRGNPGPSASGFALFDTNTKALIEEGGEYLGITTNNQAEYNAIKMALEHCLHYRAEHVEAFLDSLLVVNQLNGIYKIKNRDLWPLHQAIVGITKQFKSVTFTHIRREFNTEADRIVNKILDQQKS